MYCKDIRARFRVVCAREAEAEGSEVIERQKHSRTGSVLQLLCRTSTRLVPSASAAAAALERGSSRSRVLLLLLLLYREQPAA